MQRNRSAHTACILPNRRDIVNSRKLFSNKNRKWFFHSDRLFSLLPLKNPLRKHTSFGKSLAAWRNLAATQIFLFLFHSSKCNAFFLFGLRISKHIPSLALFTATVFICRLLVNQRSASQEAVIWEEFDVA